MDIRERGGISTHIKDIIVSIYTKLLSCYTYFVPQTITLNHRQLVIQSSLGEGGFSFVYLVKDKKDGKLFALKQIKIQLEEQQKLLLQEIEAHKKVRSDHVLKLFDSELKKENGKIVEGLLLLPYCKNGTVQSLIEKSNGNLPLEQICSFGIDICNGLSAFHSCNPPLAFRDLKPANILIGDNHKCILMDLGSVSLAKVKISSRKEAVALQEHCAETVTAPFRAPELFDPPSECQITEATDIWSVGCTLYAMAYGESPFDGSMTSVRSTVTFPNENYSSHFQKLITAILQVDPQTRPNLVQICTILERLKQSNQTSINVE
ncbi:Serine/threonine-protein kinase 16 [Boothiomyces sp. JEL0838]|nr:Serine/threonine-protein kinase 16 [Boothiomyces sp. JEL0838]KAJ3309374.1 Serine/threonine-protein kinase 16 [Boothiomyces sp. JEL0838]